jgi:integrase
MPRYSEGREHGGVNRDPRTGTPTFTRKAKALGFAGLRFHDLRHSHGSLLLAAGVSIPVVAARLGHSPDVLLRTYAHAIETHEERKTLGTIIGVLSV